MRNLVATLKLFLFILLCFVIVPTQYLVLLVHKGRFAHLLPNLWYKGICIIFNICIKTHGSRYKDQAIFMSNHLSYLDIPLIGSKIKASFVAKSEVETWPVFGFLAKLQRTAFIVRKPDAIRKAKNELQERLESGESLIIFPEGTSTDGLEVKPLKSSLFELSMSSNVAVQPVTIYLETINGIHPKSLKDRRIYTWPLKDDIEIHHHIWRFAKARNVVLNLKFHDVLIPAEFKNRKTLSQKCYEDIIQGLRLGQPA